MDEKNNRKVKNWLQIQW